MSKTKQASVPNPIERFFLRARTAGVLSIVNITSFTYILVLFFTFKDHYAIIQTWVLWAQAVAVSIIIANLFLVYKTKDVPRSAAIMLFCMLAVHAVNISFAGGIETPHFAWIFIFPILAGGTMGWRGQLFFYICCVVVTVFYSLYPADIMIPAYQDNMGYTLFTRIMALTIFTLIMVIYYFVLKEKMDHVNKALDLASFESTLFLGVFNSKAQSVFLVDSEGTILRANIKAHLTFGFAPQSMINEHVSVICHSGLEMIKDPNYLSQTKDNNHAETRITTNDGETLWVDYTSLFITNQNGEDFVLLTLEDITSRKNHESELSYLAHYDHLTKLPNRLSIQEQLDDMIVTASRYDFEFAVIFFDLDKFKHVNDIQGHVAGDAVLREVANRLQENTRRSDVVARFGGDEFVLLLNNIQTTKQVIDLVTKLQARIAQVIEDDGNEYFVGSSAGIAIYPQDGNQADDLIRKADLAMYKAKSTGRGKFEFYSVGHDDIIKRQIRLGSELNYAIERDELSLLFQPIYDINDHICGAEALVRWRHDDLGRVSPDEFIPISEENGLIVPIGLWVLDESFKMLKKLHVAGYPKLVMSVNVSYRQINSNDMVTELRRLLSKYDLSGESIILELTERVFADDLDLVQTNIKAFAELGIPTAIDDFGVGYSSLSYLKKTDFSSIKIDRSFIKDIETNPASRKLCAAIASMAESLDLSVTAEGVEKAEHLSILKSMNVDKYQGYFMSKPINEKEFEVLLSKEVTNA